MARGPRRGGHHGRVTTPATTHDEVPTERRQDCLAAVADGLGLGSDGILAVTPQPGGVFNFLLRVDTVAGSYYFKQYLDGAANPRWAPPVVASE